MNYSELLERRELIEADQEAHRRAGRHLAAERLQDDLDDIVDQISVYAPPANTEVPENVDHAAVEELIRSFDDRWAAAQRLLDEIEEELTAIRDRIALMETQLEIPAPPESPTVTEPVEEEPEPEPEPVVEPAPPEAPTVVDTAEPEPEDAAGGEVSAPPADEAGAEEPSGDAPVDSVPDVAGGDV